eukprot:ANDGO_03875.mRNA.1 hypothetical protein
MTSKRVALWIAIVFLAGTVSAGLEQCTEEFTALTDLHNSILEYTFLSFPAIARDNSHPCSTDVARLADALQLIAAEERGGIQWDAHFSTLNEAVLHFGRMLSNSSCRLGPLLDQSRDFMQTLFKSIPETCDGVLSKKQDVKTLVDKVYDATGGWVAPVHRPGDPVSFQILDKHKAAKFISHMTARKDGHSKYRNLRSQITPEDRQAGRRHFKLRPGQENAAAAESHSLVAPDLESDGHHAHCMHDIMSKHSFFGILRAIAEEIVEQEARAGLAVHPQAEMFVARWMALQLSPFYEHHPHHALDQAHPQSTDPGAPILDIIAPRFA